MKKFVPFKSAINTWSSLDRYLLESEELYRQIDYLIMLQSGLGQSSQGYPEDYKHRKKLEKECEALKKSISTALQII